MSEFKFGDIVRYTLFDGGVGIYLGYDEEVHRHVIGCSEERKETKLKWALYVADEFVKLLERPSTRLLNVQATEPTEPTEPTGPTVLEDLIDEL